MDDLLIKLENHTRGKLMVMILDDHKKHLRHHLPYIWKPRIFWHCLQHIKYFYLQRKNGLPTITLEEILNKHKEDHNR